MKYNLVLISTVGDFYYEKSLIREFVVPELNRAFKNDVIDFIDYELECGNILDEAELNLNLFERSKYTLNNGHNIYIVCISDNYGYLPSTVEYDRFKKVKGAPKEPVSLLEYQATVAGLFDNDEKEFMVVIRNFYNRPDFKGTNFVRLENLDRLKEFKYRIKESQNVEIFDYPAFFTTLHSYEPAQPDLFPEALLEHIKKHVEREMNNIINQTQYASVNSQMDYIEFLAKKYVEKPLHAKEMYEDYYKDIFTDSYQKVLENIAPGTVFKPMFFLDNYDLNLGMYHLYLETRKRENTECLYFDFNACKSDDLEREFFEVLSYRFDIDFDSKKYSLIDALNSLAPSKKYFIFIANIPEGFSIQFEKLFKDILPSFVGIILSDDYAFVNQNEELAKEILVVMLSLANKMSMRFIYEFVHAYREEKKLGVTFNELLFNYDALFYFDNENYFHSKYRIFENYVLEDFDFAPLLKILTQMSEKYRLLDNKYYQEIMAIKSSFLINYYASHRDDENYLKYKALLFISLNELDFSLSGINKKEQIDFILNYGVRAAETYYYLLNNFKDNELHTVFEFNNVLDFDEILNTHGIDEYQEYILNFLLYDAFICSSDPLTYRYIERMDAEMMNFNVVNLPFMHHFSRKYGLDTIESETYRSMFELFDEGYNDEELFATYLYNVLVMFYYASSTYYKNFFDVFLRVNIKVAISRFNKFESFKEQYNIDMYTMLFLHLKKKNLPEDIFVEIEKILLEVKDSPIYQYVNSPFNRLIYEYVLATYKEQEKPNYFDLQKALLEFASIKRYYTHLDLNIVVDIIKELNLKGVQIYRSIELYEYIYEAYYQAMKEVGFSLDSAKRLTIIIFELIRNLNEDYRPFVNMVLLDSPLHNFMKENVEPLKKHFVTTYSNPMKERGSFRDFDEIVDYFFKYLLEDSK